MAILREESKVSGTVATVADYRVNIVGHVQPVEIAPQDVLHATLTGLSRQFRMMGMLMEA